MHILVKNVMFQKIKSNKRKKKIEKKRKEKKEIFPTLKLKL